MKRFLTATLALTLLGVGGMAQAETRIVRYGDLDLATADGQQRLQTRVRSAAREVCGYSEAVTGTHIVGTDNRDCMHNALARAKTAIALATAKANAG